MKTGVATNTIIYTRQLSSKTKSCRNCKNYRNGLCKEFNIRITDTSNAKVCSKLKMKQSKNTKRKPKAKSKNKSNAKLKSKK